MIQQEVKVIRLIASEGNYLTQKREMGIKGRIVSSEIFIGRNDSPDNWKEITREEAEQYISQQRSALEQT